MLDLRPLLISPWGLAETCGLIAWRRTSLEERRHVLASWQEIEDEEKRKLEAHPCPESFREMFRAESKDHEGPVFARGMTGTQAECPRDGGYG